VLWVVKIEDNAVRVAIEGATSLIWLCF